MTYQEQQGIKLIYKVLHEIHEDKLIDKMSIFEQILEPYKDDLECKYLNRKVQYYNHDDLGFYQEKHIFSIKEYVITAYNLYFVISNGNKRLYFYQNDVELI